MKKKDKKNLLSQKLSEIFRDLPRGSVLDLGCGDGDSSANLKAMGFNVTAADMDRNRFRHHDRIPFKSCVLSEPLPFTNSAFDYVLFSEVIEHLRNPFFVTQEISRVLNKGGTLILTTPNILNLGSRMRFLFEGSFDFFREPTLDYTWLNPNNVQNMHIVVWRYQELEYLLFESGLNVKQVYTDLAKPNLKILSFFLLPLLKFHCYLRRKRSARKGGVNYGRVDKILFSRELLYGRHLILKATKE